MTPIIRPYRPTDEESWLRCRVLGFLGTSYFDDVWTSRPHVTPPGVGLVAVVDDAVVGMLDLELDGPRATIDTVAVHPDSRRSGAGSALLATAIDHARGHGATSLEAWTRDDPGTLAWYHATGFKESDHYLHVYADRYVDVAEPDRAVIPARVGLTPVKVFLHAAIDREAEMRASFSRVYVCRRFSQTL